MFQVYSRARSAFKEATGDLDNLLHRYHEINDIIHPVRRASVSFFDFICIWVSKICGSIKNEPHAVRIAFLFIFALFVLIYFIPFESNQGAFKHGAFVVSILIIYIKYYDVKMRSYESEKKLVLDRLDGFFGKLQILRTKAKCLFEMIEPVSSLDDTNGRENERRNPHIRALIEYKRNFKKSVKNEFLINELEAVHQEITKLLEEKSGLLTPHFSEVLGQYSVFCKMIEAVCKLDNWPKQEIEVFGNAYPYYEEFENPGHLEDEIRGELARLRLRMDRLSLEQSHPRIPLFYTCFNRHYYRLESAAKRAVDDHKVELTAARRKSDSCKDFTIFTPIQQLFLTEIAQQSIEPLIIEFGCGGGSDALVFASEKVVDTSTKGEKCTGSGWSMGELRGECFSRPEPDGRQINPKGESGDKVTKEISARVIAVEENWNHYSSLLRLVKEQNLFSRIFPVFSSLESQAGKIEWREALNGIWCEAVLLHYTSEDLAKKICSVVGLLKKKGTSRFTVGSGELRD